MKTLGGKIGKPFYNDQLIRKLPKKILEFESKTFSRFVKTAFYDSKEHLGFKNVKMITPTWPIPEQKQPTERMIFVIITESNKLPN